MHDDNFILEVENLKDELNGLSPEASRAAERAGELASGLVDAADITERLKLLDEFSFRCNGRDVNNLDPEVLDGFVKDGGSGCRDRLLAYILFEVCTAFKVDGICSELADCLKSRERLKLRYTF